MIIGRGTERHCGRSNCLSGGWSSCVLFNWKTVTQRPALANSYSVKREKVPALLKLFCSCVCVSVCTVFTYVDVCVLVNVSMCVCCQSHLLFKVLIKSVKSVKKNVKMCH